MKCGLSGFESFNLGFSSRLTVATLRVSMLMLRPGLLKAPPAARNPNILPLTSQARHKLLNSQPETLKPQNPPVATAYPRAYTRITAANCLNPRAPQPPKPKSQRVSNPKARAPQPQWRAFETLEQHPRGRTKTTAPFDGLGLRVSRA